ncbi:MAG: hypothetical protein R3F56_10725 [Planctomycetota bacterium]
MSTASVRPQRLGLVDVGSNAVRTRIVEVLGDAAQTVHDERTPIRVGREVFVTGALTADTIAAVADALGRFRSLSDRLGVHSILAVATAAARTARNGADLCLAAQRAGVDLRIIDGEREAALLHAAIRSRVHLRGRSILADLGAGSLEIVVLADADVTSSGSHPLGSLLLLEALGADRRDTLGPELLAAIDQLITARATDAGRQVGGDGPTCVVGIGSGIDVVAALEADAGRGHQVRGVDAVTQPALEHWRAQLAALPPAERERRHGLSRDRADLVVVALSVFAWLLRRTGADAILAPRASLRDGLLAEWMSART